MHLPLTPAARAVLARAVEETRQLDRELETQDAMRAAQPAFDDYIRRVWRDAHGQDTKRRIR